MRHDRLRDDNDPINNLEDVIDAHDESTSHFTRDIDSYEEDLEIPEDIDVDEALTFPHPKHKHGEDIELMSSRHREDMDESLEDSNTELEPSDYEDHYDDATDTYATDDMDEVWQDQIHTMSEMMPDDVVDEPTVDVMPDKFTPDKETEEDEQ